MLTDYIKCGDCLELMKELPDKSIDLILCDLPYGTTACKWDIVIPFEPLWQQYNRIIKENGCVVLFGSEPFSSCTVVSNLKNFRERIVWLKNKAGSGFGAKQKHIKVHEDIMVFSKTGKYVFNPQKWLVAEKEFLTQRKTFCEFECGNTIYSAAKRIRKEDTGERNPLSIVSCKVPFNPQKNTSYAKNIEVRVHSTQKPVDLLEYLIKTYTNEGALVLDNCMGSGSTCVAAINTGRHYIGYELEQKYYDIAEQRINEAKVRR